MLDVHPPHKAIHGTGEFLLHLFTITVGLLIAVGIEGAVERHHHTLQQKYGLHQFECVPETIGECRAVYVQNLSAGDVY